MNADDITFHCLTSKGKREVNEDSVAVSKTAYGACFVLADGLGGHGMGEVASGLVCDRAVSVFKDSPVIDVTRYLENSFCLAQSGLLKAQEEAGACDKMKTTMVILATNGSTVQWAHIGDSRLYYFKNGRLVQRTLDHSVPQMLVNTGEIKEKDIRGHEDRNRLLRVMGIPWKKTAYEIASPQILDKGQAFLLCSDGFWEYIEEKKMTALLAASSTPKEWLEQMEQEVLRNGNGKHMDNYSAIGVFTDGTKMPKKWFEIWK